MKYNKTLQKQKKSNRNGTKRKRIKKDKDFTELNPTKELADENFIAQAVWECLKDNDPEALIEIVEAHLETVNKLRVSKENDLPRATMYHALKSKNPTIKTLAKLVNCFN